MRGQGSGVGRPAEAELPDELQALERSGHLPTSVLQRRWSEVSSGGVAVGGGEAAALLPQHLQAVVQQLQHRQQVQLAGGVQAARAQLPGVGGQRSGGSWGRRADAGVNLT